MNMLLEMRLRLLKKYFPELSEKQQILDTSSTDPLIIQFPKKNREIWIVENMDEVYKTKDSQQIIIIILKQEGLIISDLNNNIVYHIMKEYKPRIWKFITKKIFSLQDFELLFELQNQEFLSFYLQKEVVKIVKRVSNKKEYFRSYETVYKELLLILLTSFYQVYRNQTIIYPLHPKKFIHYLNEFKSEIGEFLEDDAKELEKFLFNINQQIEYEIYSEYMKIAEDWIFIFSGLRNSNWRNLITLMYENMLSKRYRKQWGIYHTDYSLAYDLTLQAISLYLTSKSLIKNQEINSEINIIELLRSHDLGKEELKNLLNELIDLTILDNAFGSGSFLDSSIIILVTIWEVLFERYYAKLIEETSMFHLYEFNVKEFRENKGKLVEWIIRHNIYGIEIMRYAWFLTRVRLFLILVEFLRDDELKGLTYELERSPTPLFVNLVYTNALLGEPFKFSILSQFNQQKLVTQKEEQVSIENEKDYTLDSELQYEYAVNHVNWSKIFPEIEKKGGFSIIIGNPPYRKISDNNIIEYVKQFAFRVYKQKEKGRFLSNIAEVFIYRSWDFLQQKGVLAYIIPKSILYIDQWIDSRSFLINSFDIRFLSDLSTAFKNVKLEMVSVIGLRKRMKKDGNRENQQKNNLIYDFHKKIYYDKKYFKAQRIYLVSNKLRKNLNIDEMIKKSNQQILSNICDIKPGESLNSRVKENITVFDDMDQSKYMKILKGKHVQRFYINGWGWILRSEFTTKKVAVKNEILVQRIIAHLMKPTPHIKITATLNYLTLPSVNTVTRLILLKNENSVQNDWLKSHEITPYNLVGMLNSTFLNWFLHVFVYGNAIRSMDFRENYAKLVLLIENKNALELLDFYVKLLYSKVIKNQDSNINYESDETFRLLTGWIDVIASTGYLFDYGKERFLKQSELLPLYDSLRLLKKEISKQDNLSKINFKKIIKKDSIAKRISHKVVKQSLRSLQQALYDLTLNY